MGGDLPLLSQRHIHIHMLSSHPSSTWPVPILDCGIECRFLMVGVRKHHRGGICSCKGLPDELPGRSLFGLEFVQIVMQKGGLQGSWKLGGV